MKRKKPQGSSKRVSRAARPVQSNKVATTRKSGTVPQNTQEPKGVSFRGKFVNKKIADYEANQKKKERASTELIRGARLALAERILNEVMGAPILKGKLPRASKPGPNAGMKAKRDAEHAEFVKKREYPEPKKDQEEGADNNIKIPGSSHGVVSRKDIRWIRPKRGSISS